MAQRIKSPKNAYWAAMQAARTKQEELERKEHARLAKARVGIHPESWYTSGVCRYHGTLSFGSASVALTGRFATAEESAAVTRAVVEQIRDDLTAWLGDATQTSTEK